MVDVLPSLSSLTALLALRPVLVLPSSSRTLTRGYRRFLELVETAKPVSAPFSSSVRACIDFEGRRQSSSSSTGGDPPRRGGREEGSKTSVFLCLKAHHLLFYFSSEQVTTGLVRPLPSSVAVLLEASSFADLAASSPPSFPSAIWPNPSELLAAPKPRTLYELVKQGTYSLQHFLTPFGSRFRRSSFVPCSHQRSTRRQRARIPPRRFSQRRATCSVRGRLQVDQLWRVGED